MFYPKSPFNSNVVCIQLNFAIFPPDSSNYTVPVSGTQTGTVTPNTVPVSDTQTGTVNSPAADTVPVTVPVLGTKTGTVDAPNPLCHKASPSPNIDKDKYFHSVNSSQYDSIRTDSSSKNGSIHNLTDYRILFRLPHLIRVQLTEHYKNTVPYFVPPTAPHKGATRETLQKYCSALCSGYRTLYRTSKRLREGAVTPSYPLCRKASQCPNIKKNKRKKISVLLV